jgi:hypothetical protein
VRVRNAVPDIVALIYRDAQGGCDAFYDNDQGEYVEGEGDILVAYVAHVFFAGGS